MKILFHVDDMDRWEMAAGNAANAIKYAAENHMVLEAEIVANGAAVMGLVEESIRNQPLYNHLKSLSNSHVYLAACQNAMNSHQIKREDLCDFVTVVPAGVIEIAQKQSEGYAYIKP